MKFAYHILYKSTTYAEPIFRILSKVIMNRNCCQENNELTFSTDLTVYCLRSTPVQWDNIYLITNIWCYLFFIYRQGFLGLAIKIINIKESLTQNETTLYVHQTAVKYLHLSQLFIVKKTAKYVIFITQRISRFANKNHWKKNLNNKLQMTYSIISFLTTTLHVRVNKTWYVASIQNSISQAWQWKPLKWCKECKQYQAPFILNNYVILYRYQIK